MAIFEKKTEKDVKREKTAFGTSLANKVLLAPRITEKSFILSERGEYTFRIGLTATKSEVKRSV
ncbi:MAG: 50S ribosomal protein L23, partial [Candidatus Moranbacteria bacterium]|nr:50S ribosomal protein L23 [Candidatus Moranbacteria bacterium]